MKNLTSIALATLTANLLVGCVAGDNEVPDVIETAYPKTCAELAKQKPDLADGEHVLYLANDEQHPWKAFCVDMTSAPKEYLSLKDDQTWSSYTAGGMSPGSDVKTTFQKIRIDPITLQVDVADFRFATSTGELMHLGTKKITSMVLGTAMTCGGANASGNVSVAGTEFGIVDRIRERTSATATTSWTYSQLWETGQTIEFGAEGDCGWMAPELLGWDEPLEVTAGSFAIALTYL